MAEILVATTDGVLTFDDTGHPGAVHLAGRSVTWVARAGDGLWAIVDGREIWRLVDGGWERAATLEGFDATCLASIDGEAWIGTSEAHLYRLRESLERDASFDAAESRDTWFTPWGGPPDTRSIANWDDDAYVNVHVGGILRTADAGATWTPTIDIEADVHQVTTWEELVLAACAGGLAVSADRGDTWTMRTDGLEARYARSVAVCGDHVVVSTSNGPRGGRAAVYRGDLDGGAFERCGAGPGWFDDNIDSHRLDALPEGPVAAFAASDGSVYVSTDTGLTWGPVVDGLHGVRRLLVMP